MKPFDPLRKILEYLERNLDAETATAAWGRVSGCLSRRAPGVCISQRLTEPAGLPFTRRTLEEGSRDLLKTEGLRGLNFGYIPGMEGRYGLALLDRAISLRENRPRRPGLLSAFPGGF